MIVRRIELDGEAGHVSAERQRGSDIIRIDSILREPRGQQAWMSWQIPASSSDEDLFQIAQIIQSRCDGLDGTSSMINDYLNELRRFQD